jgi:hypothetical protein
MNAQNITLILLHKALIGPCLVGGIFGCTDTQVQMKMVVQQLHKMSNVVLVFGGMARGDNIESGGGGPSTTPVP